jgi:hypothetical protein
MRVTLINSKVNVKSMIYRPIYCHFLGHPREKYGERRSMIALTVQRRIFLQIFMDLALCGHGSMFVMKLNPIN